MTGRYGIAAGAGRWLSTRASSYESREQARTAVNVFAHALGQVPKRGACAQHRDALGAPRRRWSGQRGGHDVRPAHRREKPRRPPSRDSFTEHVIPDCMIGIGVTRGNPDRSWFAMRGGHRRPRRSRAMSRMVSAIDVAPTMHSRTFTHVLADMTHSSSPG